MNVVSGSTSTGNNGPSGKEKTRSPQTGSGDMSSSNRPEWSIYMTNTSTNIVGTGDFIISVICIVFIFPPIIRW